MFQRVLGAATICLALMAGAFIALSSPEQASANGSLGLSGFAIDVPQQSLLKKADVFRNCQKIHWCGTRRDGTPYCGPTLRCRTCKFVRTCTRASGCVWSQKCRWGPYVPPQQQ